MKKNKSKRNAGFILSYILVAIAVASVAIGVMARMSAASNNNKRLLETRDEIVSQANLIRAAILACTIQYPGGNNGLGFRAAFPAEPTANLVSAMTCPGNPNTDKSIWIKSTGVYMPRTLQGFNAWTYYHDATSARISLVIADASSIRSAAIASAALRIGNQASATSSTLTIIVAD